jgi:diacylglycerol kinase
LAAFFYRQWIDFFSEFTATDFMLIAEMFNTSIEALCDFVETADNDKIRILKDISAAATGIAILLWFAVIAVELNRL